MNISGRKGRGEQATQAAFSFTEAMVGVAVLGMVIVSLYSSFASGFGLVQLSRENLRATQVLQEKMETIRLYNWTQINSNGFVPRTFDAPFFAVQGLGSTNTGLVYHGTVTITNASIGTSYAPDMKLVVVKVRWQSGDLEREREMQTFVARYGLQNYIY